MTFIFALWLLLFYCLLSGRFVQKNVNVHYWEAECYRIDAKNKKVYCRSNLAGDPNQIEEIVVDYDYLVVSVGARSNTFNIPGVAENCHFLKVTLKTCLTIEIWDSLLHTINFLDWINSFSQHC